MKCAECVTGSNTMMNWCGSCSDRTAFSPGGNSSASSVTSSVSGAKAILVEVDARTPEYLLEIFPDRQRIGIMGADSPIRGLTVKATSTCSSTDASYPEAQSPQ